MLALALRFIELSFYELLLWAVDRISRRQVGPEIPEALRLYRENIALKAQLDALRAYLERTERPRRRLPMAVRAAQVCAYLLTRGNEPFQRYFLSAPHTTILRWAARFGLLRPTLARGGRPPIDQAIVDLIVTLKAENPAWGQRRIRQELERMGITVSEPTIARVLREHFGPRAWRRKQPLLQTAAGIRDALWALDFFAVQAAGALWVQVLLVIDVHTRELIALRAHDGWNVDSIACAAMLDEARALTGRSPQKCIHDRGLPFSGEFSTALQRAGILDVVTPARAPQFNCYAERAIGSVRRELLRHVRPRTVPGLQFYLDEYRRYWNTARAHQGLDGRTPEEVAQHAEPIAPLDHESVRAARLVRQSFAHGLLHGYRLVSDPPPRLAA